MKCDNCGNEYDKSFKISMAGEEHNFDCFECAINMLAPTCGHCETRVIGHGVEDEGRVFCCVHCAEMSGVKSLRDRTESPTHAVTSQL